MTPRAVLVEDDPAMTTVVEMTLRSAGFEVSSHESGETGRRAIEAGGVDLVVLDLMLPDVDGLEVCRRVRETSDVPVLVITARDTTADVVAGLEAGADDYLTKPFEAPELVARARALRRRASVAEREEPVVLGSVVLDPVAHRVRKDGREVDLTVTEFRLLEELARHDGQALSRQQLLELVWGHDHLGDSRVVDMAVLRLRGKIEEDPADPRLVATVRGVGYRLERP